MIAIKQQLLSTQYIKLFYKPLFWNVSKVSELSLMYRWVLMTWEELSSKWLGLILNRRFQYRGSRLCAKRKIEVEKSAPWSQTRVKSQADASWKGALHVAKCCCQKQKSWLSFPQTRIQFHVPRASCSGPLRWCLRAQSDLLCPTTSFHLPPTRRNLCETLCIVPDHVYLTLMAKDCLVFGLADEYLLSICV